LLFHSEKKKKSFDPKYLEQVSVIEVYLRQYRNLLNIFSDEQPEVALEILHNILVLSPNDYRSRFMRVLFHFFSRNQFFFFGK